MDTILEAGRLYEGSLFFKVFLFVLVLKFVILSDIVLVTCSLHTSTDMHIY